MTDDPFGYPDSNILRTNAFCGEPVTAEWGVNSDKWGSKKIAAAASQTLAAREADLKQWRDPRVGWGIVLPDNDLPGKDKARGDDAPECIRRLLAERGKAFAVQGGAPVFRYRSDLNPGLMRRYAPDGSPSDPGVTGNRGVGPNAVPWYLLIVGSPAEIPWRFQYRMQLSSFVGRLDLDPAGLDRYIDALMSDWTGSAVDHTKPVVWAVDHGGLDITRLMRRTISDRLAKAFVEDPDREFDMAGGVLSDEKANHAGLVAALGERRPAFVATSSHGATFPLDDRTLMERQLGLLLDNGQSTMDLRKLTTSWSPHGTIWYAHACCSAGCDATSSFTGAASAESRLGQTLAALHEVGARTAPLPRELLGNAKPARAFIGHVEPTFDWTLRDPRNGQTTTAHIVGALYDRLHLASRPPLGYAMEAYHQAVGGLWRDYSDARSAVDDHEPGAAEQMRKSKLVAADREAMVLLGDPTVSCG